jgi:hypothetical protein
MHGKHAITCFKYQGVLYQYTEKTMTYLNSILVWLQNQNFLKCYANKTAHTLQAALPHCIAALPSTFGRELLCG